MKDKTTYGIIAIVIVAAVFGLVAAFSKTTTTEDPTKTQHGGAGDAILCAIYPPSCVKPPSK